MNDNGHMLSKVINRPTKFKQSTGVEEYSISGGSGGIQYPKKNVFMSYSFCLDDTGQVGLKIPHPLSSSMTSSCSKAPFIYIYLHLAGTFIKSDLSTSGPVFSRAS